MSTFHSRKRKPAGSRHIAAIQLVSQGTVSLRLRGNSLISRHILRRGCLSRRICSELQNLLVAASMSVSGSDTDPLCRRIRASLAFRMRKHGPFTKGVASRTVLVGRSVACAIPYSVRSRRQRHRASSSCLSTPCCSTISVTALQSTRCVNGVHEVLSKPEGETFPDIVHWQALGLQRRCIALSRHRLHQQSAMLPHQPDTLRYHSVPDHCGPFG